MVVTRQPDPIIGSAHAVCSFFFAFRRSRTKLIYVSEEPNAAPQRLQIRKKDGSDAPQEISLPADTTRVPALAADGSQLFVVLERSTDPRHVVHRLDLPLLNNGQTSVEIGTRRLTVYIEPDLLDRCRNLVYFYPGLTLSGLVEIALTDAVEDFERKYEKEYGRQISARPGPLPAGKPSS